MQSKIDLPKAFSVRDEHEFLPIQHLLTRLNPKLTVTQMATGVHINGGSTVHWGVVHLEGQPPTKKEMEVALREAGFDFVHNILVQARPLGGSALQISDSRTSILPAGRSVPS